MQLPRIKLHSHAPLLLCYSLVEPRALGCGNRTGANPLRQKRSPPLPVLTAWHPAPPLTVTVQCDCGCFLSCSLRMRGLSGWESEKKPGTLIGAHLWSLGSSHSVLLGQRGICCSGRTLYFRPIFQQLITTLGGLKKTWLIQHQLSDMNKMRNEAKAVTHPRKEQSRDNLWNGSNDLQTTPI